MKRWLVTLVSWPVAALACGCSVDERRLTLGMGSSAGDGGSSQGGEPVAGSGGSESDSAGGEPGSIGGCADLDTDGIADCDVTLLQNATFGADVSDWAALADASLSWAPNDALDDSPSGSGKLTASSARAGASQCVRMVGQQLVIAYANAFIEPASAAGDAEALLEVSFFEQADCAGERDRFFETPPASERGAWVTVHAGGVSKPSTQSAAIALVSTRTQATGELTVYFDNVLLKTEPFEP